MKLTLPYIKVLQDKLKNEVQYLENLYYSTQHYADYEYRKHRIALNSGAVITILQREHYACNEYQFLLKQRWFKKSLLIITKSEIRVLTESGIIIVPKIHGTLEKDHLMNLLIQYSQCSETMMDCLLSTINIPVQDEDILIEFSEDAKGLYNLLQD